MYSLPLYLVCVIFCCNQPVIINVVGSVLSVGDPSMKRATQTTSVPLYTGRAGMVRVNRNVPSLSPIESTLTSEY